MQLVQHTRHMKVTYKYFLEGGLAHQSIINPSSRMLGTEGLEMLGLFNSNYLFEHDSNNFIFNQVFTK